MHAHVYLVAAALCVNPILHGLLLDGDTCAPHATGPQSLAPTPNRGRTYDHNRCMGRDSEGLARTRCGGFHGINGCAKQKTTVDECPADFMPTRIEADEGNQGDFSFEVLERVVLLKRLK